LKAGNGQGCKLLERAEEMDKAEVENADAFFASAPPLKDRDVIVARVEEFVRRRLPNDARGLSSKSASSNIVVLLICSNMQSSLKHSMAFVLIQLFAD